MNKEASIVLPFDVGGVEGGAGLDVLGGFLVVELGQGDGVELAGDGYRKIGFAELSITSPNYKWVSEDNLTVLNRFQTQKHKLAQLLGEDFVQGLTETENMELNGYVQVFDSGNIKMEYKNA